MRKFIQNKLKEQKGLTLIELLAVIVILAIIAAIAIPAIGNIIENSRYSAVKSDALNAISAGNLYFTENAEATTISIGELNDAGFLDSQGALEDEDDLNRADGSITISTGAIVYSGEKTVTFTNASTEDINGDTESGSSEGNKEIAGTTP